MKKRADVYPYLKRYIAILALGWIVFALCACGTKKSAAVKKPEKKQIVIWTWDDTFNVKAAKMAAQEYMQTHKDVQIVIKNKEREEILADTKQILAAKIYENLPDIIMIEDYDVQAVLSSYEDEFVELTDRMDYDKFSDYKRAICAKDGRMYGIPFDSGAAALFYRVDILEKAGYSERDMQHLTWDRYIEIGKDVYQKTGIPMLTLDPSDFPLVRLMMQSAGSWYVDIDGDTIDIENNQALEESLEIYKQLLENNIGVSVNGWNEFISAFQNGEVATVLSGSWIISSIRAKRSQLGLWRVADIPLLTENGNAVAASNVGGSAWYVLKNSASSELATNFVVSMFGENDDFMDSVMKEIGVVPAVKNPTVYSSYRTRDAFFGGQQVMKRLTGYTDEIPVVNYGSKTYEMEAIVEEEFQNGLAEKDFTQCLKRAQLKAEAIGRE